MMIPAAVGEKARADVQSKMACISGLCGMRLLPSSFKTGIPTFCTDDIASALGFYEIPETGEKLSKVESIKYVMEAFSIADKEMYDKYKVGDIDGIPENSVYKILMMIDTDIAYRFREYIVNTVIPYFKQNYENGARDYNFMSKFYPPLYNADMIGEEVANEKIEFENWMNHVNDTVDEICIKNNLDLKTNSLTVLGMAVATLRLKNDQYLNHQSPSPYQVFSDNKLRSDFEEIINYYKNNGFMNTENSIPVIEELPGKRIPAEKTNMIKGVRMF